MDLDHHRPAVASPNRTRRAGVHRIHRGARSASTRRTLPPPHFGSAKPNCNMQPALPGNRTQPNGAPFHGELIAVGDAVPVGVLARVSVLRKCHRDRERGRQCRQLRPDTPSFLTRVLSLSADKKLAQTVRFERVSVDENASLDGEARGRHSIPRRFPDALIRMARICSAGKRRQIIAAICRPKIH